MSAASWASSWLVSDHIHLVSEPSGPGLAVALDRGQPAVGGQPQDLRLDVQRAEPVGDDVVVEQAARGRLVDQVVEQPAQQHLEEEGEAGALVHQRRQRDLPAVADAADDAVAGDPRVLDEELVELRLAGDLAQRPHLDGVLLHVHQEVGQPLVLRRLRVRARDEHAPLRVLRAARPDLLPGDPPAVAVGHRAGLERREVGARVGLGEALAPDLLAGEDRAEEAVLLLVGAPDHQRRPAEQDAEHVGGSGARARPSSSKKIADSVSVAPRPPCSGGQWTAAQPPS